MAPLTKNSKFAYATSVGTILTTQVANISTKQAISNSGSPSSKMVLVDHQFNGDSDTIPKGIKNNLLKVVEGIFRKL